MYTCKCGKEFEKRQSFIGHQGHCKSCRTKEELFHRKRIQENAVNAMANKHIELSIETRKEKEIQRQQFIEKWLSEQHKCEYCGKVMNKYYGSGRFCNRSCSNGWVSLNQSDEAKAKKIKAGKKNLVLGRAVGCYSKAYWNNGNCVRHLKIFKSLDNRLKISKGLMNYYKLHPVSEETRMKISVAVKKSIEKGRRPGYLSLKRSESYPEKYWSEVLLHEGISFEREYMVKKSELGLDERGCYFLDFLLPGKVDLEIDGSQHYDERQKQQTHDKKRTQDLELNGYKVYRIRWRNPVTHHDIVEQDIKKFLNWYREYQLNLV